MVRDGRHTTLVGGGCVTPSDQFVVEKYMGNDIGLRENYAQRFGKLG